MKLFKIGLSVLVLVGIGTGAFIYWPKGRVEQEGSATVVRADIMEIAGVRHRLAGIVVPLPDQQCLDRKGQPWPCGAEAIKALTDLTTGTPVLCRPRADSTDLSDCFVGGDSLSELMVRRGWAMACRSGHADLSDWERNARFLLSGVWRGTFDPPIPPDQCQ